MSAILLNDLLQIDEDSVRVKFNNYSGAGGLLILLTDMAGIKS